MSQGMEGTSENAKISEAQRGSSHTVYDPGRESVHSCWMSK